jgi:hypothetical protein
MYVIIYVIIFCCFNFTLSNKSHVSHVRHALWHVRDVWTPSFYSAPYLQLVGYCFKAMWHLWHFLKSLDPRITLFYFTLIFILVFNLGNRSNFSCCLLWWAYPTCKGCSVCQLYALLFRPKATPNSLKRNLSISRANHQPRIIEVRTLKGTSDLVILNFSKNLFIDSLA